MGCDGVFHSASPVLGRPTSDPKACFCFLCSIDNPQSPRLQLIVGLNKIYDDRNTSVDLDSPLIKLHCDY